MTLSNLSEKKQLFCFMSRLSAYSVEDLLNNLMCRL